MEKEEPILLRFCPEARGFYELKKHKANVIAHSSPLAHKLACACCHMLRQDGDQPHQTIAWLSHSGAPRLMLQSRRLRTARTPTSPCSDGAINVSPSFAR